MKTRFEIAFIFLTFLFVQGLLAQKTALVLSGGGAKGLSHVGVLKALEENNIPIDYVVGNSMGALVGALYAAGFSPGEIEEIVLSQDFQTWIGNGNNQLFQPKANLNPDASFISIPFSIRSGFESKFPTSLISPFKMDFAVMQFFAQTSAAARYDFDQLFVPFRCVASDIDSTQLIVLKSGQLGAAVRASTTFPFYIRPIRIDNRLLFDGGMYNNFPSDVAENEFHPDFIIGSKAAGNYPPSDESDIVSQVQNMLMRKADYELSAENGTLIESKIGKTGVLDFSQIQTYIDSGYAATLVKIPEIQSKIHRSVESDSIDLKRRLFRAKWPPLTFDSIFFSGIQVNQARNLRKRLNYKNKYHQLEEIRQNYFTLMGDDKFSQIYPQLKFNFGKKDFDLFFDVKMAERWQVGFGGNISSASSNEAFILLKYRFLQRFGGSFGLNAYYGRFYSSVRASGRLEIPSSMPFFIEVSGTMTRKDYFGNTNYFFEDPTPAFLIQDEQFVDLTFGHSIGKYTEVGVGSTFSTRSFDYYQSNSFTRNDTSDRSDFELFIPHLSFEYNSLNRKMYASHGLHFFMKAKMYLGTAHHILGSTLSKDEVVHQEMKYFQVKVLYDNYFAHYNRFHFGFQFDFNGTNQPLLTNYTNTLLFASAYQPVPEMQSLYLTRYRSFTYAGAGLKTIYDLFRNADFRLEAYVFQPYQRLIGKGDNQIPEPGTYLKDPSLLISGRFVYHTLIGPLSVSLHYLDRDTEKLSFTLNFGYLIFNQSIFD